MTKLAMDDPELSPSLALFEATRTFNEREHVRGYSPIQHALGRSPDPCDRLFPTRMSECPELLVENATGEVYRKTSSDEAGTGTVNKGCFGHKTQKPGLFRPLSQAIWCTSGHNK